MTVQRRPAERVDRVDSAAVAALGRECAEADGVEPFGEQPLRATARPAGEGLVHLVVGTEPAEGPGGALLAYAQVAGEGNAVTAELAVRPGARGAGAGRALVEAVLAVEPAAAVWAHGDLPPARALAARLGLTACRELIRMRRPADAAPVIEPAPGPGVELGTLAEAASEGGARWPGLDARAELLRVNNAAFAWHPEQGGWTRPELDERLGADWVDPAGIVLAVEAPGRLLGFHWTKVDPDERGTGEVYVVGVDPAAQGRGLGGVLTAAGLRHLAAAGCGPVVLYVEGDNTPALRTYERYGFAVDRRDVTYVRARGTVTE